MIQLSCLRTARVSGGVKLDRKWKAKSGGATCALVSRERAETKRNTRYRGEVKGREGANYNLIWTLVIVQ